MQSLGVASASLGSEIGKLVLIAFRHVFFANSTSDPFAFGFFLVIAAFALLSLPNLVLAVFRPCVKNALAVGRGLIVFFGRTTATFRCPSQARGEKHRHGSLGNSKSQDLCGCRPS